MRRCTKETEQVAVPDKRILEEADDEMHFDIAIRSDDDNVSNDSDVTKQSMFLDSSRADSIRDTRVTIRQSVLGSRSQFGSASFAYDEDRARRPSKIFDQLSEENQEYLQRLKLSPQHLEIQKHAMETSKKLA